MALSPLFQAEGVSSGEIAASVAEILDATRLLSFATISSDGAPSACNMYFAYDEDFRLYFLTPTSTEHVQNFLRDQRVAVVVADTQQTGDGGKRGLQISGVASRRSGDELAQGLAACRERFPATAKALASEAALEASGWESRIYVVIPEHVTIFDERTFGEEHWIKARLTI